MKKMSHTHTSVYQRIKDTTLSDAATKCSFYLQYIPH